MAGLPQFPLPGSTLSKNVGLDRVSLCMNAVGNSTFPAGQYVFFGKANSTWYRVKPATGIWSNDILLVPNTRQSSSQIDANGYPVTAWVDASNRVQVRYYVNGVATTTQVASGATFPTVVVDQNDVYMVWVPPNYTDRLKYAQLCTGFTNVQDYLVTLPGKINMMNIQVTQDQKWFFAFEIVGPKNKVYIGFSNPALKFSTADLVMFTTFMMGKQINDYFVIAEALERDKLNLAVQSDDAEDEQFTVAELASAANLTLYASNKGNVNEYFIVAQVSDIRALQNVLLSDEESEETFFVSDSNADTFNLNLIPSTKRLTNDYLVVADDGYAKSLADVLKSRALPTDIFVLDDSTLPTFSVSLTQPRSKLNEQLVLADPVVPTFSFAVFTPVFRSNEYFVLGDRAGKVTQVLTLKVDILDYTDGKPTPHEYHASDAYLGDKFYVADALPVATGTQIIKHVRNLFDSFMIAESVKGFNFTLNLNYNIKEKPFHVAEQGSSTASAIGMLRSSFNENLQLHEILDTIWSGQTDFSQKYAEAFLLAFGGAQFITNSASPAHGTAYDAFMVADPKVVTTSAQNYSVVGKREYAIIAEKLQNYVLTLILGKSTTDLSMRATLRQRAMRDLNIAATFVQHTIYRTVARNMSPFIFYPLNEPSGTTASNSMQRAVNDGTIATPVTYQVPTIVNSDVGMQWSGGAFQGVSGPFVTSGGAFSYAGWWKRSSSDVSGYELFRFLNLVSGALDIFSVYPTYILSSGTAFNYGSAPIPNDTNWHHYAFVYGGGGMNLYVDGILAGNIGVDASGIRVNGFRWSVYAGSLVDVGIWTRALSGSEVSSLASAH